jgi:hypothetical protein
MSSGSWRGAGVMLLAGALGAAAGIYDFYDVATGIDGTGGVELVIASCLLMVFGALMVIVLGRGLLASIFRFLLLLDVVGTGTAAYFLESRLIMAAMALAALGWIIHMNTRGRTA